MRFLLALAPMLLAAAPAPQPAAHAAPAAAATMGLSVALPPTAPRDALQRLLLKPYATATGTDLATTNWDGASLDSLAPKPPASAPDLALLDANQVQAGCRSQVLARLDWGRLNRDRFLPQLATDCGAGAFIAATALAWDHDKFTTTPAWADFWDVARHPGRRALQHTAHGNLEIALLADGVAPGDIYRTLRTQEGQDRAFRKLDQLKPYLVWWDQPAQPAQMLATGKVLLTSAPAASVLLASAAAHRHFGVQWAGSLTSLFYWAVPQAAPHPALATLALLIATDPARLAEFATATALGPATQDALTLLPAAQRADSPAANLGASLQLDEGFWAENAAKLDPRFAAWLAK